MKTKKIRRKGLKTRKLESKKRKTRRTTKRRSRRKERKEKGKKVVSITVAVSGKANVDSFNPRNSSAVGFAVMISHPGLLLLKALFVSGPAGDFPS